MVSTSSSQFGSDFVKEIVPWMFEQFGIATSKASRIIWDVIMTIVTAHWVSILLFLFVIFVIALVIAFTTGRWAMFGSVLYNYFYFGALFVLGLMFGPEIFANTYFEIILIILYVSCFILVGKILKKTGLKRF